MSNLIDQITILAIGVENYQHLKPLRGPTTDVANLRHLLVEDPTTALFAPEQFIELIDPEINDLRGKINQYVMTRQNKDNILVFYFSGHGIALNPSDFGFCTVDTFWQSETDMALPLSLLRFSDLLQTLIAGRITPVIIIDACYSGMAGRVLDMHFIEDLRGEVQRENASTYALLCSCTSRELSVDTSDGGIFSHYLVEAAREGIHKSQHKSPYLSLQHIFPNLSKRVDSYTASSNTPQFYIGHTLPEFPIVKNTQYKPLSYQLSAQFAKIIKALWNDGNERELTRADFNQLCGAGAYGNHKKLSLPPWQLVEGVPGDTRKRRLTERGRAFAQGQLKVPKKIVRNPETNEFVAEENSIFIDINSV